MQYNSYTTHYKEAECLRQQVEPFLYNFGVDVVFHGKYPLRQLLMVTQPLERSSAYVFYVLTHMAVTIRSSMTKSV